MKYDYIFFDLDGTITDSAPGIIHSVKYALDKMGIEENDVEHLKAFIGPPLLETLRTQYEMDEAESLKALGYFREYFTTKGMFENSVYDGMIEALQSLHQSSKKLVIATSKPEEFAKQIAQHLGFAEYFYGIYGASMDETRCEKAEVIAYALKELKVSEEDKILMIGDRKNDISGAKENHLDSMGVLYGYGSLEELEMAGADYITGSTTELAETIWNIEQESL